jgi:hypothetical protein
VKLSSKELEQLAVAPGYEELLAALKALTDTLLNDAKPTGTGFHHAVYLSGQAAIAYRLRDALLAPSRREPALVYPSNIGRQACLDLVSSALSKYAAWASGKPHPALAIAQGLHKHAYDEMLKPPPYREMLEYRLGVLNMLEDLIDRFAHSASYSSKDHS